MFILLNYGVQAQDIEFHSTANIQGITYSGEESPFWIHSNKRGRINELTHAAGWINGYATYNLTNNAEIEIGLGALYSDGYLDKFQLEESYLSFQNSWLMATIGRKQRQEEYHGLSATNENILWSLNARPLPGLSLKIIEPVYFWKRGGLAFKASLEEFITDDDRFVPDTRVHHKSFHLIFDKIQNFEFTVGLQHFVQWAGTSPDYGKLPGGFNDYIDVFTGKEGSDDVEGEEANALGNHLGSYEVEIKTSFKNFNVVLIYNHLFEDGSGRMLFNTPDGRYGIYLEDQEQGKLIDTFMYEFYYTKDQSEGSGTTDGNDNYFVNNLYKSGWIYENRVIGVPFITLNEDRTRVYNNTIIVHHIGISGVSFGKLPYKFLTSYRKNYGYKGGGNLINSILSTLLEVQVYQDIFEVNLQLGTDFNSVASPNFGTGIHIRKNLF